MKTTFLRLGATIVGGGVIIYVMAQSAPKIPGPYEGVTLAAPVTSSATLSGAATSNAAPSVNTNTPPPGFPSVRRPPPKIAVGKGEDQPIDTKFGLRYTVPADWRNFSTGIAGWEGDKGSITYGSIADYKYGFCTEQNSADLGMTGMTGRNGVDVATAAKDAVRQADFIFADSDNPDAVVDYSDPVSFEIEGEPAVRIHADVTGLKVGNKCDPPAASFDIVTTTGFSNATVAVFMMTLDRGIGGALDDSAVDSIIATIEKSPAA